LLPDIKENVAHEILSLCLVADESLEKPKNPCAMPRIKDLHRTAVARRYPLDETFIRSIVTALSHLFPNLFLQHVQPAKAIMMPKQGFGDSCSEKGRAKPGGLMASPASSRALRHVSSRI
jgi:hypothetical protein